MTKAEISDSEAQLSSASTCTQFSMRFFNCLALSASLTATAFAQNTTPTNQTPIFSPAERARIVGFWNAAGRYQSGPDLPQDGKRWVTRLTPAASIWFRSYTRALSNVAVPPTQNGTPQTSAQQKWEGWVRAKLTFDSWMAQKSADNANIPLSVSATADNAPPYPGLIPDDLLAATGNPPSFRAAVAPWKYTVNFPDGETISYRDHINIGNARYGYYRFDSGVQFFGPSLKTWPQDELKTLWKNSGFTPFETHVVAAVSRLEGGFASVNTYDTGWVSIGFIQFASLDEGGGSLGELMRFYKNDDSNSYQRDFQQYGIDVDDKGLIVVVDLTTGAELHGADANRAIIEDKRLTAIWQRAGLHSVDFQLAQLKAAKARFYPSDRAVQVLAGGKTLNGKVSDVIRSEAGMATLFDRSVNIGNIRLFNAELQNLVTQKQLTSLQDAAKYERELIGKVKWREDFLQDNTLSQPR